MHHAASVEAAGRVHPPQGRKNSSVVKRSVIRNGHKSSISLEDQFWDALREIADHEHMAISALVATIDHGRTTNNLSSAIRVLCSIISGAAIAPSRRLPPQPKISHDEGSRRPPHVFCGDICRLSASVRTGSRRRSSGSGGYWTSVQLDHRIDLSQNAASIADILMY
jgi:predicted DNA-binding ribbon-helix-helix protein